jgi:hypothetical protein
MRSFRICNYDDQARWMTLCGHVTSRIENKEIYVLLIMKRGGGVLGSPRCRFEDNIRVDITGIVWYMKWIHLAQYGPVVGSCLDIVEFLSVW